jgi:hypothetical protein
VKRFLYAALGLVVLIAGCTAAAHLHQLQPPAVPKSPLITVPAGTAPATPVFQRGIDIDAYTYPGQNVAAAARADVRYITGLHANAVSISFPFFMGGEFSSTVGARPSTPTPAQIAAIVSIARAAGLYVSVRPLLDESSLAPFPTRVRWVPPHRPAWFASYTRFVVPYAQAAQRAGAQEFIAAAELQKFAYARGWAGVDMTLSAVFHGRIVYAANFAPGIQPHAFGGAAQTVDAYPPLGAHFRRGWELYAALQPEHAVLTEVGIDAVAGAWRRPYKHEWPHVTALDPQLQAQWFAAACHAAMAGHLGGIYFWPVGLGGDPGAGPTLKFQGAWGGAGAAAVSRCFATIEAAGK